MKIKCLLSVFVLMTHFIMGQSLTNIVLKGIGPQHYIQNSIDSINYTVHSVVCPTIVTDVDGNLYNVIAIGEQCWLKENLKTTHFKNGVVIPSTLTNSQWTNTLSPACADCDNNPANIGVYGKLYNWYAVSDTSALCPVGWHPSSRSDWKRLEAYLDPRADTMEFINMPSAVLGVFIKEAGFSHWLQSVVPMATVTNSSGFTALPGGMRANFNGTYYNFQYDGEFWTSTNKNITNSYSIRIGNSSNTIGEIGMPFGMGMSVRCVKD
jgi:uncharacterized protein (TIGR02145 family)